MTERQNENSGLPDRYQTIKCLGTGATGAVFHAFDSVLKRDVAIKVLHEGFADSTVTRFQREAQAASRLTHRHVVSVLDFGIHENKRPYLVMEHLDGNDLKSILNVEGSLTPERTCRLTIQLCDALQHANSKGVLHRDIKPSNIIIQRQDGKEHIKIVDFGLARLADQNQSLTSPGATLGTPYYLSPEVISGKTADARSDIYSIGCVLFECLSGHPPFVGDNANATLMMHVNDKTPPLGGQSGRSEVPVGLEKTIAKALEKDPAARFQTSAELKAALEEQYSLLLKNDQEKSHHFKSNTKIVDDSHNVKKNHLETDSILKKHLKTITVTAFLCGAIICGAAIFDAFNHSGQQPSATPQQPASITSHPILNDPQTDIQSMDKVWPARFGFSEDKFDSSKMNIGPATSETEAIDALQKNKGKFRQFFIKDVVLTKKLFDSIVNSSGVNLIQLINVKGVSIPMLKRIAETTTLKTLRLNGQNLDDSSLQIFAKVADLDTLDVEDNQRITGSGLRSLSHHKVLARICLGNTGVTKAYLKDFLNHKPKNLKGLKVGGLKLNDTDVRSLNLANIHSIELTDNPITNETVSYLASNQNLSLRHIYLAGCNALDDRCLADLPKIDLESLSLSKTKVTNLTGLSKNPNLSYLVLEGCELLSAEAFKELRNLRKLKLAKLNLRASNVTDRDLALLVTSQLKPGRKLTLILQNCKNVSDESENRLLGLGVKVIR